eukprot:TRINITY_DN7334_c0_g1_i1.p1 TRINITY_DN7334_c0_g1~~TRINITY_DN7334_c0_g1_i1.p1  ORF type:complete len:582 (+),score=133.56 TRINITY_DN7334_c0_g1_i1:52-1746(+)
MGASLSKKARDNIHGCKRDGGVELNLSDCEIRKVNRSILRLKLLVCLNLSMNYLQSLPSFISNLKDLEELNVESNEIEELPSALLSLKDLRILNAIANKLDKLPGPIARWGKLEVLEVGHNNIQELPEDFDQMKSLKTLNYSYNNLREIPDKVWKVTTIQVLDVSGNQLSYLPESVTSLKQLKVLRIGNNKMELLPTFVATFRDLEEINCCGNTFKTLPDELCTLNNLKVLDASSNQLNHIDNLDFRGLAELLELNLSRNGMDRFNSTIGHCQKLKFLDLSDNNLEKLPHQVGWCGDSLRKLYLDNNKFFHLPGEISFLNPALDVRVSGCPLKYPFDILHKQGPQGLGDNLKQYIKAYPMFCTPSGDGMSETTCGKPTEFLMEAFDKKEQPRVNGGDKFAGVMIQLDPEADQEPARVDIVFKDNRNGTYGCFYNARVSGNYEMTLTENGDPVRGSPYNSYVNPDVTVAYNSTARGPGLQMGQVGCTSQFELIARDRFSNQQDHGGDPFMVAITGGSEPRCVMEDRGDGSYLVQYSPGWADVYQVQIFLNGEPIQGSPFVVQVPG